MMEKPPIFPRLDNQGVSGVNSGSPVVCSGFAVPPPMERNGRLHTSARKRSSSYSAAWPAGEYLERIVTSKACSV